MLRSILAGLAICSLLVSGCVPLDVLDPDAAGGSTLVPNSPFGPPAAPPTQTHTVGFAPATRETALRVDRVGRDILAANPQIGLKPLFATLGATQPELFHQGTKIVHITEGLVSKCQGDGQLAALLCMELAKMVADREEMATPSMRNPEHRPPMEVPIGNAGQFSAPDMTYKAELAPYERERQRARKPITPPDPAVVAAGYLGKAGFSRTDLDAVAPLLALADRNCTLEKQISASGAVPAWTPHP